MKGLAGAAALPTAPWDALLIVWALASGLLAFFPDAPVGTPTHWTGAIHLAVAFLAFLALRVGTMLVSFALRTRPRRKPIATPMTALSWGTLTPLRLLGPSHFRANSLGGLYEKSSSPPSSSGCSWPPHR